MTCVRSPVSCQTSQVSTVPNASSPRAARSRAPGIVVEQPRELGAARSTRRSPARCARAIRLSAPASRRSLAQRARCAGPARRSRCATARRSARSQTTVVSRWLVMPIAATSLAATSALRSASRATSRCVAQISRRVVLDPARLRKDLAELAAAPTPPGRRPRRTGSRASWWCPDRGRDSAHFTETLRCGARSRSRRINVCAH